jgi:predicted GIY-YIG superfamily endonuclease
VYYLVFIVGILLFRHIICPFLPMSRRTYSVYVVELSKRVFTDNRRFREANPQFNGVLECVYVGMTSKRPEERLKQHLTGALSKKGHRISSNIVQKYGMYLRPSLYTHLNPLSREDAMKMEEELANELKRKRYAVWWA